MANAKLSSYTNVTLSTGTIVGLQGGVNVQYAAASFLLPANNLSDLSDAATAQSNLGLGTAAPLAATNNANPYLASVSGATVSGNIPKFADTLGTVVDSAIAFSNSALAYAVTCNGSVTAGNMALYADNHGSLVQNVAALNNVANSSATPGTVRALIGEMTSTATTQTSGNLVGVRGAVNFVGTSTAAFMYGVQGKLVATGTLAGGQFQAGVFGQADFSGATLNGCQFAPIWGDYGTSIGTNTSSASCYGLAMTNTTAAVLGGQLYLYGGATALMLLETNVGGVGVTYFKTAGTTSGSWGNATPPTPSKVLTVSVDGTLYYLPLVAQNT